ncbi:histone acetyltransferase complex subunit Eaf7 [Schizosaccharomyces cryophilus OY26]|uniref:Histone acetyltransferase complex subunit Eaf7 n=1 Tax=Schizosaccharomyces cryophilus (strain OY26 / ATCC MYA-4695 / CBS 11777 / NBRC 106824 / NRRL Y48691) TaxID=653667 RepID=S9VVP3_SCHCR|nr:histone acetyltransferase complex subunit Eaf7 [Schizosaccharomyces cryophilus OY26]EPY50264.1 histone acetyltransferase complex subunit Eaf7 [Schizosaccharomyces cryophilus OY26]
MSSMGTQASSDPHLKEEKEEKKTSFSSDEWSILEETLLLKAICQGLRPIGTEKHFHMIGMLRMIHEGCQTSTKRVQDVWKKLETLYNLQEFERLEAVPSPSVGETRKRDREKDNIQEEHQIDFELPKYILNTTKLPSSSASSKSALKAGGIGEKKMTRSSLAAAAAANKKESSADLNVKEERDEDTLDEPAAKQLRSSSMKQTTPLNIHDEGSSKQKQAEEEENNVYEKHSKESNSRPSNTQAAAQKQSELANTSPPAVRRSTRSRRT